jgi:4-hydroxy-tetrahydrodipicolinate synthase
VKLQVLSTKHIFIVLYVTHVASELCHDVAEGNPRQMEKVIRGVYSAVITPRRPDGRIDEAALRSWLSFLVDAGVRGFAINGATGEFCLTTKEEFRFLMELTAEELSGRAVFVAGIGAGSVIASVQLGEIANDAGACGVLLPMPYFFPYSQEDLMEYTRGVAGELESQILLYNLPQFTSGLEPETSLRLIRECPNVVGIKDSSGSLDTVSLLTEEEPGACRVIGNDGVLVKALKNGVADAVVSGVACVLPELITQIFDAGTTQRFGSDGTARAEALSGFIEQLDKLPTPWGLKVMAEARGIAKASFPMPLAEKRRALVQELALWFEQNYARLGAIRYAPR